MSETDEWTERDQAKARDVAQKHPTKIIVVVHRSAGTVLKLRRRKFVVPCEVTLSEFVCIVRKHSALMPSEAFFLFEKTSRRMVSGSSTIQELALRHVDGDRILHMEYCTENAFG